MSKNDVSDSLSESKKSKNFEGEFMLALADMTAARILKFQKKAEARAAKETERDPTVFLCRVRGLKQSKTEAKVFKASTPREAFLQALNWTECAEADPVIEILSGKEDNVILDLDFHGREPPHNLRAVADTCPVTPDAWWFSRSGGLHMLFTARGDLTAAQTAAIARLALKPKLGGAKFEILTHCRHPRYEQTARNGGKVPPRQVVVREVGYDDGTDNVCRSLLSEIDGDGIDEATITEWLEDNGFRGIGIAESHEMCLICPTSDPKRNPVWPGDYGITCHVCRANGRCYEGCKTPGFISYQTLIGGDLPRLENRLTAAIRNKTHWGHAKYFIEDKESYEALLLKYWLDKADTQAKKEATRELIKGVFNPYLRITRSANGIWLNSRLRPIMREIGGTLRSLPTVKFLAENSKGALTWKVNAAAVDLLAGDDDVADLGYPGVVPLFGCDIAFNARFQLDWSRRNPPIYAVAPADPPFAYIPEDARDMEWVKWHLQKHFPGCRFDLLVLLIALKGLQQLGCVDEVPILYITGPSMSGKSAHVRLASVLSFDRATSIKLKKDRARFEEAYGYASSRGSFAVVSEAEKNGVSGREILEALLHFERSVTYHVLYQGPREIDRPAVLIFTDPSIPPEILEDPQTRRRTIHYNMGSGITDAMPAGESWYTTCGTGTLWEWLRRDPTGEFGDNLLCARMLTSYVMDRFFAQGMVPQLATIGRELNMSVLSERNDGCDEALLEYIRAVLTLPVSEPDSGRRIVGEGYRRWQVSDGSALARLADDIDLEGSTQRIEGARWSEICGIPGLEVDYRRVRGRRDRAIRWIIRHADGRVEVATLDMLPNKGVKG